MSQDELTGFGLENMPMTFGSVGSASTAVDGFDSTMDMSILLLSNISNDEPVSPRNHTSGTFDNDSLPRGMFFDNSLPLTPTTFTFSHSDQNIPDLINPLADEPIDRVVSLSPTCEGRDHEFYRRGPEADGFYHCPFGDCDFPPKVLKCEYHKHIDSHLKPFRCRKAGCNNQAFSSVACRLRHEREMHKMHNAEEFLCRYDGSCDRKSPGNGFTRSFSRGEHERLLHHITQEGPRSKGRPKAASETSNTHSTLRRNSAKRKLSNRDNNDNSPSDKSSTPTIDAMVPTTPKHISRPQKYSAPVTAPLPFLSMEQYMAYAGSASFGSSLNTTISMQNQAIPGLLGAKRTRSSKTGVKSNSRHASQTSKRLSEQWDEHIRKIRDLAWSLPDVPNDSSGSHLHSIVHEAEQLLQFCSIPRDMDEDELKPPSTQTCSL